MNMPKRLSTRARAMRCPARICGLGALFALLALTAHAAQSGDTELARLIECALPIGQSAAQRLEVELIEQPVGQPATHLYARIDLVVDESSRRMRVLMNAPREVAGSAYLVLQQGDEREMHMYLPALERSRQLGPDSRVQLMGTGFEVRSLFSLLLGGNQLAWTGGRHVEKDGRSLRKVHVTGFDSPKQMAPTTLWIDKQSCQTVQVDAGDGTVMTLDYPTRDARWPQSLSIQPYGAHGPSVLKILERQNLPAGTSLTAQRYYR